MCVQETECVCVCVSKERERLTKTNKNFLQVHLFLQLIFSKDGTMILSLGKLYNLRGPQIHTVVEVSEEEKVMKLVCQEKLVQLSVLQSSHAFQYVVVVLISPVQNELNTHSHTHTSSLQCSIYYMFQHPDRTA